MKHTKLLLLITILLVSGYSQTQWQSQWVTWPYPLQQNNLKYCVQAFPAPNAQYCKKCLPGLIQYNNIWYFPCQLPQPSDFCISTDYHLNCLLCTQGYYVKQNKQLNGFNSCQSKKIGCQVYDQNKKNCLTCMPGYKMNTTLNFWNVSQNYCVFNQDVNCIQYNLATNVCLKCANGFLLSGNSCVVAPKIANCETANTAGTLCTKCLSGYQLTSLGTCFLIPRIQNCEIQSLSVCQKCISGYFIDQFGKCSIIPKISNCETQTDFTCTKCLNGFNLQNNQCVYFIPNCLQVKDTKCIKCSSLYVVSSIGTCLGVPKIQNCFDQSGTVCNICEKGYTLNTLKNGCELLIENCLTISGSVCTTCLSGYALNSVGQCVTRTVLYDLNCRKYDQVSLIGKCLECSQGFYLSNNQCLQVDPYCKTYDSNNGFCLSCYIGYKLNIVNGKCDLAIADQSALLNCNRFDYIKNICVKCAQGSQFDINGICQRYGDAYCKIPALDLKSCNQCYTGYFYDSLNLKKCIRSPFNCAVYNNQGTCASCPNGYYLDTNSNCTQADAYCKSFDSITKKCAECYQGYGLNKQSKCQDVMTLPVETRKYYENCAKYDFTNNVCTQCYFRWFLAKDSLGGVYCKQVSDFCKDYNSKTGLCITCYLGYYLKDGNCLRFV